MPNAGWRPRRSSTLSGLELVCSFSSPPPPPGLGKNRPVDRLPGRGLGLLGGSRGLGAPGGDPGVDLGDPLGPLSLELTAGGVDTTIAWLRNMTGRVEQLGPGKDASGMADQRGQQLELGPGELDRQPVPGDGEAFQIERQVAEARLDLRRRELLVTRDRRPGPTGTATQLVGLGERPVGGVASDSADALRGGAVLNDATRAQTQREIDRLTTEIDRFQEDANAEVQELQQQLGDEDRVVLADGGLGAGDDQDLAALEDLVEVDRVGVAQEGTRAATKSKTPARGSRATSKAR